MTVDEIMREALTLDVETRASIAHELLSSLESLSESEVEVLWIAEAKRRSADVKAGRAQTFPAHESLARARASRQTP
ncbi:MAG: addiction module antitoxin RelB [Actinobacteria bacterium HGW-Actinobacteria-10]|nr:MAG: addiction module antitoxin RelB [Actinobacteria bacterium HGW-Actinobacteria-10]